MPDTDDQVGVQLNLKNWEHTFQSYYLSWEQELNPHCLLIVSIMLCYCYCISVLNTHTHTHTHTPRENNNMKTNKKTYLTLTPSVTVTLPWLGVGPTLPVLTSFWLDHWWDSNSTQDHYELLSWPQFIREFMKKEQVEVVHWCNQDT